MSEGQLAVDANPTIVPASWRWSEDELRVWQLRQLNAQLRKVLPANEFYAAKFGVKSGDTPLVIKHLEQLSNLPTTTKSELVDSASRSADGVSRHHTFELSAYSRIHRTSGTTGQPLMVLDTQSDWNWWSATWQHVLHAADVTARDRVFMAFSFGPFIGFWSAHQACVDRGATVIPGGGLSSLARLEFMKQTQPSVVCCTPSYALHLAEVAQAEDVLLHGMGVRCLIVAGEAGGSLPAVRSKISQAWNAQVVDHSGATEIGPWGFGWPDCPGLHVIESSFIAELLPLASQAESRNNDSLLSELVLTSLGRYGAPVFRYRTGDVVRWQRTPSLTDGPHDRCRFLWLPGGVVGRADNMLTIRGVNIFPSSIDSIVRELASVSEYQAVVSRDGELDQLHIEIEAKQNATHPSASEQLEKLLTTRLGLRIPVILVAENSLARSELKSQRWQDRR